MRKRIWLAGVAAVGVMAGLVAPAGSADAVRLGEIVKTTHSVRASDGRLFTLTNHLTSAGAQAVKAKGAVPSREYLVVWAGDWNASDHSAASLIERSQRISVDEVRETQIELVDAPPGPDFLAVVDADPASATYGKVVNTATVSPLVENEPHHMQYLWHKGHKIFAGGLFSDTTYVFDVTNLPEVGFDGVNLPTDTPCGSVPDAYWTLKDGTAYGTYMGGPDIPGPCLYTNGEVRIGNGFAGTPGSLVRLDKNGATLSEVPAALADAEDADRCVGVPDLPLPSCANPHGIQAREDLNRLITTDYAEPKNVPIDPLRPVHPNLFRDTVRIWDITDRDNAKVVSVGVMPDGPRKERNPGHEEPRGIMEGTVTNLPKHRGAFASSMCGGVIYYTPDITKNDAKWREVFDDTTAAKVLNPNLSEGAGCDGGGWVQTSLDDRFLYHAVIGRNPKSLDSGDPGVPKMVYVLNIEKLLAAGNSYTCNIDELHEVYDGGDEADCPAVAGVIEIPDQSSGGPHWGTPDNFVLGKNSAKETKDVRRISSANYFVARSSVDGNHKVCMIDVGRTGKLTLDTEFRDENHGTPCVDFNRTAWPHGNYGNAKPHSQLFVVPDRLL